MSHKVNLCRVLTAATGNSTPITLGAKYSVLFQTPAEAGAMDGRTYTYLIVDGNNFELGKGVYTASGTTLSRATVISSGVNGTLGTSRITLTGTAQVRLLESSEDMDGVRGTRAVTGTSDTLNNSDLGYVVTYANAAAVSVSLAQASVSNLFLDGWATWVRNKGPGTATYTPATSTINGAATLVLAANQGAMIWSDGTNYQAFVFRGDLGTAAVRADTDFPRTDTAQSLTAAQQAQLRANVGVTNDLNIYNLSLLVSAASGALTVEMRDAAGNVPSSTSPVVIDFRSATVTDSKTVQRAVTALNTITAASAVTLGSVNATAFRLWVVAFDDAGTVRLGLINCSDGTQITALDDSIVESSLGIGVGANNVGAFYTAGSAVTAKPYRILGYIEWNSSGVAAAGTWTTTNLAKVQMFGRGVKKPGDRVQIASGNTNGTSIFTSSTPAVTVLSKAFTPKSAANPLLIQTTGNARAQGAGTAGQLFLRRGASVNIDTGFFAGITNLRVPSPMRGMDLPNTNAAVTYAVYMASSDNATGVNFPESPSNPQANIIIEELMG